MPRTLRTADKILFILHYFGDFLEKETDSPVLYSGSYQSLYSFASGKRARNLIQQAVWRLISQSKIIRWKTNSESYLRLTALGRNKLLKSYTNLNFRPRRDWDGHWRLASFDVAESYRKIRHLLRAILADFGFRKLQESLYLSPFGIEKELKSYLARAQLDRFVRVFVGKFLDDDRERAAELWRLHDLNEFYRRMLKDFEVNGNLALLRARFLEAAAVDPYLPPQLLPDDWLGEYVEKKARLG